jgi:hypothetical protein
MSATTLRKINKRAKQIRAAHPGKSWKAAQKQAGKEVSSGKVGSTMRKKGGRKKTRRKVGAVASHKPRVRRHKPKTVTAREIHEVKRVGAISYTGGKVKISGTADVEAAKRQLRAKLGEQAGWLDVAISSEHTKTGKNRLRKKKREIIAELNRIK